MSRSQEDRLLDLLEQWEELWERGHPPSAEDLCPDDPDLQEALRERIRRRQNFAAAFEPDSPARLLSPDRISPSSSFAELKDPDAHAGSSHGSRPPDDLSSQRIGRYRIERLLGRGGFGLVYLASDDLLNRQVVVKVPHPELVARTKSLDVYLAEARSVAQLDHPHIVPVYDVGKTAYHPCYIVSRYIEGRTLAEQLKSGRLPFADTTRIVARVADALHAAHKRGIVHRDVKPANILLGADSQSYVVDFGLALRDDDVDAMRRFAGTPAYMSPEQARGEAHRVDGRSDVFSLGIVLYELLVGRRPFRAESERELLRQNASADPKPPRQIDDSIPRELERICLKALGRRASERYSTALNLADDLRQFQSSAPQPTSNPARDGEPGETADPGTVSPAPGAATPAGGSSTARSPSDTPPVMIVPKGLRAFDEHDADFFLELLPGPRDREGFPEGLRFWKSRIESTAAETSFPVGVLYGPSGSGKSSLVKAGILPRLTSEVVVVQIEASADETETRLRSGLQRACPWLSPASSLADMLAVLRRQTGAVPARKVLIVLDQFEQWLHGSADYHDSEMILALRHCDGVHVQCLMILRDDFWMAVTRFMQELEIPIVEGRNALAVDGFPHRHARKVLKLIGHAFGTMPETDSPGAKDVNSFITAAIEGLAENGQVIPVRIALFADMFKHKPWTSAILRSMGGMAGVGVTYLEETFGGPQAPPSRRVHQAAARAVLAALLPSAGASLKGHSRSYAELSAVSGYSNRPADFADLMQILDREIRLITPTDPAEAAERISSEERPAPEGRSYQLTHDYFVPVLRDWLLRHQKSTMRGRAELLLEDTAAAWERSPDHRSLPSAAEALRIWFLTDRRRWTPAQRRFLRDARRMHLGRVAGSLAILAAAGFLVYQAVVWQRSRDAEIHQAETSRVQAEAARQQKEALDAQVATATDAVQTNRGAAVPFAIRDLKKLPGDLVRRQLKLRYAELPEDQKLGLAYALADFGEADPEFLVSRVADAPSGECANLISALRAAGESVAREFESALAAGEEKQDWRTKARLAIVLLFLGDARPARGMSQIENRPDPVQRTVLIDEFARWHGNLVQLEETSFDANPALRSAISLGMAEVPL